MNLNEQIERVLKTASHPLTAYEISKKLKSESNDELRAKDEYSNYNIQICIDNFPSTFQQLNGKTILINDDKWRGFLVAYSYILNILRGFYSNAELQFFVSALFLSKRIIDHRTTGLYSIELPFQCVDPPQDFSNNVLFFDNWLQLFSEVDESNGFELNIFSEFQSLLMKIGGKNVAEVYAALNSIDTRDFSPHEFAIAFEYLIEINITENYRSGLIRTPPEVIELMVLLLQPLKGSVLDPVCGTAGLISGLRRHGSDITSITGTEVNYGVAQLAYMNMLVNGEVNPDIRATNCFDEFKSSQKYDNIIGDLPLMGVQNRSNLAELETYSNILLPKNGKGFSSILIFIVAKLSGKGRAIITVSDSFLSATAGSDGRVRDLLVKNDMIEAVISIPANSLKPYTNGKASILILNKSKPSYLAGKIKFIDAEKNSRRSSVTSFDLDTVMQDYHARATDSDSLQIVSVRDVLESNTLQVSFFSNKFHEVTDLLRTGKALLLGDLVEIRTGSPLVRKEDANYFDGVPYVKIENLEKDILNMRLSSDAITNHIRETSKYSRSLFSEEIIMVARIGDNLKPTYFIPSMAAPQIAIHSNVISLSPRRSKNINLEYLYYQLYSPFVQKQIEQKRKGAVMPTITLASLNSLVIPFMSVELQREFIASQKSNIIAQEKERVNQRLKLIGFEEQVVQQESDIVSTLVHELRPKLLSLNVFADKLLSKIDGNNIVEASEINFPLNSLESEIDGLVEPQKNYSIRSLAERIVVDSKHLNDVLTVVKDVMGFSLSEEQFLETDLLDFISSHLTSKQVDIAGRYKWEVKGNHVSLGIHRRSFGHLIDQLLFNAEAHAFKDVSPNNKVVFFVKESRDRKIAIIEYSNNGAPFLLSQKDYIGFFQKSKTSLGSGIGGNYIYRIVKAHKGDLRLKENQNVGFSMIIEIPLKRKDYE